MHDLTHILFKIESGEPSASEQLLPLVYDELRKLAAAKFVQESPGQTLQATALVHEAYVRLVDQRVAQHWSSRGHFFGAAAEAMRRILVENARRKMATKRAGGLQREELSSGIVAPDITSRENLIDLDSALDRLEARDPIKAELVKLRYFAGLTMPQAADALGIGLSTAEKYWTFAKCWLRSEMEA